ncbi:unnamed protein product [Cylicocyclus nassatus]|uniref:Ig-like domain-containing protein n=1 Tax=Cylicocyclus nassatus TaxID=53992 RepID=A0AA36GHZ5_CYLNA|nr:unnamed protein product [Cylicocyclus nassatus]
MVLNNLVLPYLTFSGNPSLYYGYTIRNEVNAYEYSGNSFYMSTDKYYPIHSEPELYNNNVYFGFTDNVAAGHSIDNTKTFSYVSSTGSTRDKKYFDLGTNIVNVLIDSAHNIISDGTEYASKYYRPSASSTYSVEMKECIIDEMRLTKGVLYNGTFSVPLQKFDAGHIWVAPQGIDYNFGDMAYQTNINITDVRIGGAQYTYPQLGNVYIDLNSNGVGSSAAIYDGSVWLPLNYAVWNGYQWQDGKNFNFRNLTFYDVAVSSGEFDNDSLREINEKLGLIDEKLGTGVEYSQADLSNMNNESVSAYNPLAENGSQVEGSLTSTLLGVWVATLFSVASVPTPSYDFNKGLQWFQGIPYEENAGFTPSVDGFLFDGQRDNGLVCHAIYVYYYADSGLTKTLTDISVNKTKITYFVVIHHLKNVTNFTVDYSSVNINVAGTYSISVTYEGITKTIPIVYESIPVTLTSISAVKGKTNFYVGDTLNTNDFVVTGIWSDGSETVLSDYTVNISAVHMNVVGSYPITVFYEDKTTTVYITVNAIEEPPVEPPLGDLTTTKCTSPKIGYRF